MTPTDRVDALLRETRGSPSAGDLRRMVEEAERDVMAPVVDQVSAVEWNRIGCDCACHRAFGRIRGFAAKRALARERKP